MFKRKKKRTKKQHQADHKAMHLSLVALMDDFTIHTRKQASEATCAELVVWAYAQSKSPSELE